MPLLGGKRRATQSGTIDSASGEAKDDPPRASSSTSQDSRSGKLRSKASSPHLGPRTASGETRPGLKRGNSKSWYGSWNNKATAVAQVAKESISIAAGTAAHTLSTDSPTNPLRYMNDTLMKTTKTIETIHETGPDPSKLPTTEKAKGTEEEQLKVDSPMMTENPRIPARTLASDPNTQSDASENTSKPPAGTTWLGWWSRPDSYVNGGSEQTASVAGKESAPISEETGNQAIGVPVNGAATDPAPNTSGVAKDIDAGESVQDASSRTWFGLWSAGQNQTSVGSKAPSISSQDTKNSAAPATTETKTASTKTDNVKVPNPTTRAESSTRTSTDSGSTPKPSGWAFWSRDLPQSPKDDTSGTQKHLGELAVADTPSQSHPEAAQFNEGPRTSVNQAQTTKNGPTNSQASRTTQQAKSTIQKGQNEATKTQKDTTKGSTSSTASSSDDAAKQTPATKALKAQQGRPNMVEPKFSSTYPPAHVPSYWETLGHFFASPFGYMMPSTAHPHVSVSATKPKIKNAIAIGVHGYFPAPLLQKIIGQPTGTSIRFANHAAAAIRQWTETNQPEVPCEIEQVALEGEGFIADRVTILWKLLLNWLTQLRNADLILVAAHSQGVPVAIMLVAKLIQLGCLNPTAKVVICAMAGVNLGPFGDYKSRFFGGSAAELFEFSRPDSRVSKEYASAAEVVLRHGVRVTYAGSLDDQLVSLESSLFTNLSHPYIQRAVFVDGRLHAPDFITHLVAFALKLRNLGISDHGLIRELSAPVAGSIYGGEGHSRIYDDEAVYQLALQFGLETTDIDPRAAVRTEQKIAVRAARRASDPRRSSMIGMPVESVATARRGSLTNASTPGVAPVLAAYEAPLGGVNSNPYFLPWAMRGILEEEAVRKDMQDEVTELIRLFDKWTPASKALKDVKFRLEAVKSKL